MAAKPLYIFKLLPAGQKACAASPEILSGMQYARLDDTSSEPALIINGLVGITAGPDLGTELKDFYEQTWMAFRQDPTTVNIAQLYQTWLNNLDERPIDDPEVISGDDLRQFAATMHQQIAHHIPPPPPTRPTVLPGGTRPAGIPKVAGHLPFQDLTTAFDIFYRFEAWPSSIRVGIGSHGAPIPAGQIQAPGTIKYETYANPSSELPFLPTGFAAVARNALPRDRKSVV